MCFCCAITRKSVLLSEMCVKSRGFSQIRKESIFLQNLKTTNTIDVFLTHFIHLVSQLVFLLICLFICHSGFSCLCFASCFCFFTSCYTHTFSSALNSVFFLSFLFVPFAKFPFYLQCVFTHSSVLFLSLIE